MELLEKISQSFTQKGRLLAQLATFTGRMQGLADRLTRHGEACIYPQMKEKIEAVAAAVKAQVKTLNAILSDNRVWAKLPEMPAHQGINNWERISGDLVTLGRLNSDLNQHAVRWLSVDAEVSERLRNMAEEQIDLIDALQEIAARSDPQAID
ncbi:MAG: hypothetical protein ACLQU2_24755 [Candidatus Binataceae bacterium]